MRRTCHFRVCVWLSIFSLNIDNMTGKIKINSRGLSVCRRQRTEDGERMTEDRTLNAEVGMRNAEIRDQRPVTSNQRPGASNQGPAASCRFINFLIEIRANSGYKPNIPVLQHSITPLYGLGDTCCLIVALKELTHLFEVKDHHGHTRA
jgi:hypothetical protein